MPRGFILALLFCATVTTGGAVVYTLWGLTLSLQICVVLASGFVAIVGAKRVFVSPNSETPLVHSASFYWFDAGILLCDALILLVLFQSRTTDALRSPWESVPTIAFVLYGIASMLLILKRKLLITHYPATAGPRLGGGQLPVALHLFTTLSVTAIIFPIGFGFDQLLHQAAERVIALHGFILPKTPYYIGQYALVTILHTLTRIPTEIVDHFLVPTLAAVFIPPLLHKSPINQKLPVTNYQFPISFILIPLPFLTLTTPHNLAQLWLLLTVLLAADNAHPILVSAAALAATATHPLVGIPSLVFLSLWYLERHGSLTRTKAVLITIIGASIIPAIFAIKFNAQFSTTAFNSISYNLGPRTFIFHHFDTIRDFLYNFQTLRMVAIALLLGAVILRKKSTTRPFRFAALSALLGSLILASMPALPDIIFYEQSDFSLRLLLTALIFLLPATLTMLAGILETLMARAKATHWGVASMLAIALTASWYFLYLRSDDGYAVAHAYTTSSADIDAVRWIDRDAQGVPYIVLSNQQVSAAAVAEFGFRTYYKKNIFFYPIPTGGPLYQSYLQFVYTSPTPETIKDAMKLAGVNRAYVVLNQYWTDAERIAKQATPLATNTHLILPERSRRTTGVQTTKPALWIFQYESSKALDIP